jgi:hypothetical protein
MPQADNLLYSLDIYKSSPGVAAWAELMAKQFDTEQHVPHVVPSMELAGVASGSEALIAGDFSLILEKTRPWMSTYAN